MTTFTMSRRLISAAALSAALVLSGCGSGRDAALSEKLARAEMAAKRAEEAQAAAEKAAKTASAKAEQVANANAGADVVAGDTERAEPVDTAGKEIGPAGPA